MDFKTGDIETKLTHTHKKKFHLRRHCQWLVVNPEAVWMKLIAKSTTHLKEGKREKETQHMNTVLLIFACVSKPKCQQ